jgi:hypothetical protein
MDKSFPGAFPKTPVPTRPAEFLAVPEVGIAVLLKVLPPCW